MSWGMHYRLSIFPLTAAHMMRCRDLLWSVCVVLLPFAPTRHWQNNPGDSQVGTRELAPTLTRCNDWGDFLPPNISLSRALMLVVLELNLIRSVSLEWYCVWVQCYSALIGSKMKIATICGLRRKVLIVNMRGVSDLILAVFRFWTFQPSFSQSGILYLLKEPPERPCYKKGPQFASVCITDYFSAD